MTTSWINFTWMWVVIHKLLCPRCATLSLWGQKLMFSLYKWVQQLGPHGLSPSPHLTFSYPPAIYLPFFLGQTHSSYPPAAAAARCALQTVAQGCCHCEEVRGRKCGLCQDSGFCPGQRAGAAMGHRSPLSQLLSYSSLVAAAQQKSESGFKWAQEEALAVQAVYIAQTTIPYLLWVKSAL